MERRVYGLPSLKKLEKRTKIPKNILEKRTKKVVFVLEKSEKSGVKRLEKSDLFW